MLDAVKRFVRRVLVLHLVLLGVVVLALFFAARGIYEKAREQALEQEGVRLQMLSQQTARVVESHYLGIMQDLDLILRDASKPAATQPVRPLAGALERGLERAGAGGGGSRPVMERGRVRFDPALYNVDATVPVTPANTALMWRSLRGRVSMLFVVDQASRQMLYAFPEGSDARAGELLGKHGEWIVGVKAPDMSALQTEGDATGYHLIALPAVGPNPPPPTGSRGPREQMGAKVVVAVVPMETIKDRYFDPLNDDRSSEVNAVLLDQDGQILVALDEGLVGHNLIKEMPGAARGTIEKFVSEGREGVMVAPAAVVAGKMELPERIVAGEQISHLPGRRWVVAVFTPVAAAEKLVANVFRAAVVWAVVLAASIGAVLVSTSVVMIRSRAKIERMRNELLTRELQQARQIQLAWLPDGKAAPAGLDVAAVNLPASHVSGDFYNWFSVETGADGEAVKVALVIGDVTGHGMAAAFLMSTTQLLVRTTLRHSKDVGRCLQDTNKHLCSQGFQGQFVTMVVMVLDLETRSVEVASAGHAPPLVSEEGVFRELKVEPSLVLGVDKDETYRAQGFILHEGATIVLYTDGVVEAMDGAGRQYSTKRLVDEMNRERVKGGGAQGCVNGIVADVKAYTGGVELADDLTVVAMGVR